MLISSGIYDEQKSIFRLNQETILSAYRESINDPLSCIRMDAFGALTVIPSHGLVIVHMCDTAS